MTLSFIGVSSPQFVIGLILFYIFAYWLSWLPTGGYRRRPTSSCRP